MNRFDQTLRKLIFKLKKALGLKVKTYGVSCNNSIEVGKLPDSILKKIKEKEY